SRAIIEDGSRVLVHCVAGVSRSASIVLAYLTKYHCRSLRDAYHLMKMKRPLVRPNLGFWRQLIAFEQNIKETPGSVRLVTRSTTIVPPTKSVPLTRAEAGGIPENRREFAVLEPLG
ncbi:unnamed protein product, partial [Mesorhabditis spiculigera]